VSRARVRLSLAGLAALGSAAAVIAFAAVPGAPGTEAPVEAEARGVVTELFRTLGERRYASTCALLADGFFAEGPTLGRRHCALGLRLGFMGSPELRVRLEGVRVEGDRAAVRAVVNGLAGQVTLVREAGRLRILRLDGP
jgi:hypothetical protein